VTVKNEALRRIAELPDYCTWEDVFRTLSDARPGPVYARELQVPYGAASARTETTGEGGMSYDFDVIVERDAEGWYVGSVPALRGCHTQARSVEELLDRVREAAELCLEVEGGQPVDTGFVGVRRVSVRVWPGSRVSRERS
jgi:predicted RNase H-like HicB family nuclease